jgi:hypothetical protein
VDGTGSELCLIADFCFSLFFYRGVYLGVESHNSNVTKLMG